MNNSDDAQTKQEELYWQVRLLTDRQLRIAVYLVVDGFTLPKAVDLVYNHFKGEVKSDDS